ncbi:MAG: tRNA (N6-isopentenyl adenosine(37)-C2)-methylthiotransferase MiaB [Acidobacteria bacterium]|nr:tRNA (N6-isopentenyl adenosine(37)-C2)-methylthiotransferase MiaB [Acidobacteriota bacterium]
MNAEKVYIETLGCQMNVADSERTVTSLRASGYEMTDRADQADVILLNTCSVRDRAEQKVFNRFGEIRRKSKSQAVYGVMGCVAQLEGDSFFDRAPYLNFIAGTRATDRIPLLIREIRRGRRRVSDYGEREAGERRDILPGERHAQHVAFIPIVEGCNKFCTYCIVPYSRGRERSRVAWEILEEVRALISNGYQEIQLIGQNVNSYRPKDERGLEGFSGATPFSRLLRAVAATGIPRIKYTTSFPRDFHADIIAAMDEHENLCNWVHLPVQSGSDRVLRAMRRGYTVMDYFKRISYIKHARRRYALTSDLIVGFPGETDEDFEETVKLVERCQYDSLYLFKYSKRPRTPAAKLTDEVPEEKKTVRFRLLEEVQSKIQARIFAGYLDRHLEVLVEGLSAKSKGDLTGHSTCNKVINFPGDSRLVGSILRVKVTAVKSHSLYGSLVS